MKIIKALLFFFFFFFYSGVLRYWKISELKFVYVKIGQILKIFGFCIIPMTFIA